MGEGGRPAETANENLSCWRRTGPRQGGFYTDVTQGRLCLRYGISRVDSVVSHNDGLRYNAGQFCAGMKHQNDHKQGTIRQSGL